MIQDLVLVHLEIHVATQEKCWGEEGRTLEKTGAGKLKDLGSDLDMDSG